MALTKNQIQEKIDTEISEKFDFENADLETRKFRKLVQKYKEDLKWTPIKIGNKTVYFEGAGYHKIVYRIPILGPDVTKFCFPKGWVVYGKENPEMRRVLLKEIVKIKGDKENVFKEYQKTKNEAEGRPSQEGYTEDFIKASDLI